MAQLKSPYNDQTRTKDVAVILEEWISANWTNTDVPVTAINFGQPSKLILQGGTDITLRCYSFFSKREPYTYGGGRWRFEDHINIEVYSVDHSSVKGRDPRAISIMKYLESQIIINEVNINGFYTVELKGSSMQQDPIRTDVTKIIVWVVVTYLADILPP